MKIIILGFIITSIAFFSTFGQNSQKPEPSSKTDKNGAEQGKEPGLNQKGTADSTHANEDSVVKTKIPIEYETESKTAIQIYEGQITSWNSINNVCYIKLNSDESQSITLTRDEALQWGLIKSKWFVPSIETLKRHYRFSVSNGKVINCEMLF